MTGLYRSARKYRYYDREHRGRKRVRAVVLFLLLILVLFNAVSYFLVSSFITPSAAMEPALPAGSRFLATPLTYGIRLPLFHRVIPGFRTPRRGDIVLLRPPFIEENPWYIRMGDGAVRFFTLQKVTIDPSRKRDWENGIMAKRIIGLPGDTVRMEGFRAFIRPAGESEFRPESELYPRSEPVIPPMPENWDPEHPFSGNMNALTLGEGQYFVLSDSRSRGSDSADWGVVEGSHILMKVFFRYWPHPGFRF